MASHRRLYMSPPHMSGREQPYIDQVFAENWIAPVGPQLDQFERQFAQRIGVAFGVAVASGTAALHLILRHLNLQPDDEVICSTFTFCASANPIVYEHAQPVFIDSDWASWNLDPNLLEDELTECARRGRLPRAVIAVDILGQSADMDAICQIAGRYEIPVIEDAAEALGGTYKDRPAGSSGWASFFSFNGNKIITTSGGGMICSDDGQLAENARFLATQARDPAPYYLHTQIGFNYRLSNVLAAVGLGQLEVLDDRVAARRRIRDYYAQHLGVLDGISMMPEASYGKSNCWITTILVDPERFGANCEDVRQALESQNIEARRVWLPMHAQPAFSGCRHRGGEVADEIFRRGLCLPSGSAMTDEDLKRVVQAVREATD
jgi:dTDP-4-amino-4,6-dideoxygalactose transaminase